MLLVFFYYNVITGNYYLMIVVQTGKKIVPMSLLFNFCVWSFLQFNKKEVVWSRTSIKT